MGFAKLTSLSLTDLFVRQIEGMILSGELAVGSRLPPARELAVKMEISRTVITAGIVELESLGFVEVHPRQGVFVCDYRRRGTMDTLVSIMRYNGGTLKRDEVKSLVELREAVESVCVRLVIERATDEKLAVLAPILDKMQRAESNGEAAEQVFEFHHELCMLSGNMLLPLTYYSFRQPGIKLWEMYCRRYGIQTMYKRKENLYAAILNRDLSRALELTHTQMSEVLSGDKSLYTD
ncbi:MAG: FCD domain-containing protein [Oscillospiraceae bacterium]